MSLETLLMQQPKADIIESPGPYCHIDLSVASNAAENLETAAEFEKYISDHLAENKALVAFGGYNEERNLYHRSEIFDDGIAEARNIHVGTDIWIKAGTPVYAALDGKVHSFDFNTGLGNYGPTIILEHQLEGHSFYTLYGHLSMESIEEIEIGDEFRRRQKIGTLGDATVNGNYAPHLHFQIIKDIADYFGDYPGVCAKSDRAQFLANCPDPNLLLKLK